jgi:hypothetical protein
MSKAIDWETLKETPREKTMVRSKVTPREKRRVT